MGLRISTFRQSFGSDFSKRGTLIMRRHSGQGACLPARSALRLIFSSHWGHWKLMVFVLACAGAGADFDCSTSAAKALASRSDSVVDLVGDGDVERVTLGIVKTC